MLVDMLQRSLSMKTRSIKPITQVISPTLDGFNANLDGSTGFAKECLANAHELNFHTDLIDDGSRLTLSEITDYCSQFGADATLEKKTVLMII